MEKMLQLFHKPYNPRDKMQAITQHVRYMLARSLQMFKYDGLPETITARNLELLLQCGGFAGITEIDGKLYALTGGLGGEPDAYYMPTILTVANPALKFNRSLKINEECIIIPSDDLYLGLLPIYEKYGQALTENELSMFLSSINTRIQSLISASDDSTMESAKIYLKRVEDGEIGVIGDVQLFENLKTQPYTIGNANNQIKNLIEYEQYLKASEFNEIGLDANFNMKRETLTNSENEMNRDALVPLIDNMLECRRGGIEKVNEKYGTEITVDFASAWKDNEIELELEHENMKTEETKEDIKDDERPDET